MVLKDYMKYSKIFLLIIFCLITTDVFAKETVYLNKCIDGDTAKFKINEEIKTVRFLAIDTPEYTNKKEAFGKEASEFVCNKLKSATRIEIEYDDKSDLYDKYDRLLAWIWTDDILLQEEIVSNGLGEVAYIYGDYLYVDNLILKESIAKENKINIWSDTPNNSELIIIIVVLLIIIINVIIYKDKINYKKVIRDIKKIIKV